MLASLISSVVSSASSASSAALASASRAAVNASSSSSSPSSAAALASASLAAVNSSSSSVSSASSALASASRATVNASSSSSSSSSSLSSRAFSSAAASVHSSAQYVSMGSSSSSSSSSFTRGGSSQHGGADHTGKHSALTAFFMFFFNIGLIFGPHIGYLFQYADIRSSQNIDGYSCIVSIILLASNTLRLFYYPGAHYAVVLLLQAVFAILTHGLLLHQVLEVNFLAGRAEVENRVLDYLSGVGVTDSAGPSTAGARGTRRGDAFDNGPSSTDMAMLKAGAAPASGVGSGADSSYQIDLNTARYDLTGGERDGVDGDIPNLYPVDESGANGLWHACVSVLYAVMDAIERWFMAYEPQQFLWSYGVTAVVGFVVVLLAYAITNFASYLVNTIGYLALGIEATLVIPQILRNARRRSTEGLAVILILTWVCGDAVKIVYFVVKDQPLPFLLCGCFQLALDFVVVGQYYYYKWRSSTMRSLFPPSGGAEDARIPYTSIP